ncbi:DUF3817 domain-containing protein [Sulfuriroseicoccus oceanibius]|uniref:DUF3817 domain-containing protein n=1 Tax=Sulfuriroseicoccus oceanibius TaxID=2707525 RepID=A0A6B3LFK8_9BACT|nr:DUF3817 domain-containing protein [Sulfuriroseicoccus oceanibius]QQL45356.1 DUF3817 domain-containing protein [Sulfuriroseicoccus oceanibius]
MKAMPVHIFRIIGHWEAVSFILLMGIAMPLKRIWDMPLAVTYVGWAHGVLFVLYAIALYFAMEAKQWSIGKAFMLFVAALVPFGPYIADRWIKPEDEKLAAGN